MLWRPEDTAPGALDLPRRGVVVAGPGSSLTVPGIVVSEIVRALAMNGDVTRIEVDVAADFMAGLHRAPSLAATHNTHARHQVVRHFAPRAERQRLQAFRRWIGPDVETAIAYAWPGIDNAWLAQFLQVAKAAGATTTVLCASLPASTSTRAASLASMLNLADFVYVGDFNDAVAMKAELGSRGPVVKVHEALSLSGKNERSEHRYLTTFLLRDDAQSLSTVLAAFDAIPEAWIGEYQLRIVMRYEGASIPEMVAGSYHADNATLIGHDLTEGELEDLCLSSSALVIGDPFIDSRVFAKAVEAGIPTVVITSDATPLVGKGYVGGLLADARRPASVHVAFNHALRLEDLRFPGPQVWKDLARRVHRVTPATPSPEVLASAHPAQ